MCHASDAPDESEDGFSGEYSESHGSEEETPGHSSRQGLNEVKDWGALDFSIVRDAALRKVSLLWCYTPLAASARSPCTGGLCKATPVLLRMCHAVILSKASKATLLGSGACCSSTCYHAAGHAKYSKEQASHGQVQTTWWSVNMQQHC